MKTPYLMIQKGNFFWCSAISNVFRNICLKTLAVEFVVFNLKVGIILQNMLKRVVQCNIKTTSEFISL